MPRLLLVRHAIAQDRDRALASGVPDERRPLTEKGVKRMRRAAAALRRLVPDLALIATSPLLRAVQTADLLAGTDGPVPVHVNALCPECPPKELLDWLQRHAPAEGTTALVGHEPDLSRWAAWLLTKKAEPLFSFGKTGAALLDVTDLRRPGHAGLCWLMTPAQLRELS